MEQSVDPLDDSFMEQALAELHTKRPGILPLAMRLSARTSM